MEVVLETLFEVYMELMKYIIPEGKITAKKYKVITIIISFIIFMIFLIFFFWGGILVFKKNNLNGLILMILSLVSYLIQIVIGFILRSKKIHNK